MYILLQEKDVLNKEIDKTSTIEVEYNFNIEKPDFDKSTLI